MTPDREPQADRDDREAAGPESPSPAVAARLDRTQARVPGTTPATAQAPPVPQADTVRAEVRLRSRRSRPAAAAASSASASSSSSSSSRVSADELLRDRLAPALVAAGAVDEPAIDGLVADGLEPVDVPSGGDVHLHIGRVEVHQPAAQAPVAPEPRPAGRSSERGPVDHADYLARQQRRWT
jgi:hypothetical protein